MVDIIPNVNIDLLQTVKKHAPTSAVGEKLSISRIANICLEINSIYQLGSV